MPVPVTHASRIEQDAAVILVGGIWVSREGKSVKTLLGSCIAACLWDPEAGIGGMNHFMLPDGQADQNGLPSRFGVHAMELLIGEIQKLGGERGRLHAKIFGGGQVLQIARGSGLESVPAQNIRFITRFLQDEGIPIVSRDVGGHCARQVIFQTGTGRAFVRRLRSSQRLLPALPQVEVQKVEKPPAAFGEVTLFDD